MSTIPNWKAYYGGGHFARFSVASGETLRLYTDKSTYNYAVVEGHSVYLNNYTNDGEVIIAMSGAINQLIPPYNNKGVTVYKGGDVAITNNGSNEVNGMLIDLGMANTGINVLASFADFSVQETQDPSSNNDILNHWNFNRSDNEGREPGLVYTSSAGLKYSGLYKFGEAALNILSASDGIKISKAGYFDFATDWTIDFWIRYASGAASLNDYILRVNCDDPIYNNGLTLSIDSASLLKLQLSIGGLSITNPAILTSNVYSHVLISKIGDDYYLFLDGTPPASPLNYSGGGVYDSIGFGGLIPITAKSPLPAFITDEFRIKKGDGLYSTAFTPPTVPYS